VAQLYIRALAFAGGARPVRELKGFQKILLQPGETRDVSFTLSPKELGFYDADGHWIVQPGEYQVWICPDSASGQPASFELE
jgi:beta-glucosidase